MVRLQRNAGLILILIFFAQNLFGQMYQFKDYGIEEGLSHPFIYTINEDKDGFIWIGTGEGLCKFDGFEFKVSTEDDTLTNGFVTSSYLDTKGNLWFGHNSGQVTRYNGSEFKLIDLGEDFNSTITSITGDGGRNVFIASQNNGIAKVDKTDGVTHFTEAFKGQMLNSISNLNNDLYLIGSSDGLGLYSLKPDEFVEKYQIEELSYIAVQTIRKSIQENAFWIGTEDSGFYLLRGTSEKFDSYELVNVGENFGLAYSNVQDIHEDQDQVLWISTFGDGVFKLIPDEAKEFSYINSIHYNTQNGLQNNFVKEIYQDWEGNHWFGTYGNGLAFLVDETFTLHYQNAEEFNGNILSIEESDEHLWLGGEGVIIQVNKENNEITRFDRNNGVPDDEIVGLYLDKNDILFIGTDENGIYKLNANAKRVQVYYQSNNSLGNKINSITGNQSYMWAGTDNGVLEIDLSTGETELYNTSTGLPHNDIRFIYPDSDNHIWIATKSQGLFTLKENLNYSIESNINFEFTSITEDLDGNIWAATYGNGVFKFEQDSIKYFSTEHGLKSSYCYSIIADDAGKVWIGHRLGMSSIDVKTEAISVFGTEMGISGDCNYNAVLKRADGVILTGTTDGMVMYDPSKARKAGYAPKLNITEVLFSDEAVSFEKPIQLPYNIYKLNISYVGLSYSSPDGVTYQYKLDGYDLEWSDGTKDREVYYPRVEDGNYTFILKACNADGDCVEEPLKIKISIKPPFWKTWWFISLSILIGAGAIYFFIKYRERKQKAMQEYLENELNARTKEVVKQKDLLEIKNRDITDSINYAQRIQQSILPSVNTISDNFSGAFVYYVPRDIVSGDFYWYDRINEDKFLIVCADSTGHGVPGAFMSMIGTTLIKDICSRPDVDSPGKVLSQLDRELQSTLNQNIDAERAHDGMDIIVCEIDVNTHYMRFSSAMRPLILYKNKELQYVKGTKASIGGDPAADKEFENVGFQLHEGDIIYMFSDGYPDQFGGPRGKKFKLDRVKNMLADVCDKPMEVQHEYVSKTFTEWRGKLQQVDDVLFMGVRL